ncbi:unnamed protein product [Porites evermanni]|uniref:Uncharacterized protein n=1 Tax=Porites evermanni TaxID=104178 RepID=A0ABN8Q0Y5_9CNID|nr:unnamed protein product [Porites evermanni]
MDIKLAKTNIRKQKGGNLLTSILSMGRALAPTIGKTLGLSALAGLASEGASQLVKKISGGNNSCISIWGQRRGFLITLNAIGQLMPYEDLLSTKQKRDLLSAIKTGSDFHIN